MKLFPGPIVVHRYEKIASVAIEANEAELEDYRSDIGLHQSERAIAITADGDGDGDSETRTDRGKGNDQQSEKTAIYYLQPHDLCNIGIMASYFCIGVTARVTLAPVQFYLIQYLHASSTVYSVYDAFRHFPWTLKFLYGMISDSTPIFEYRRKSWLIIGWAGVLGLAGLFAALDEPSIYITILIVTSLQYFLAMADVATDTLCVERGNLEEPDMKGNLQATGFIYKSTGKVLGAIMGTYLFDNGTKYSFGIGQMFQLEAAVPLLVLAPFIWPLLEFASTRELLSFVAQMGEVWRTLKLRAVWRPLIFIYVFSVLQVPNGAWSNFLVVGLGFNDRQMGYLTIASALVGWASYVIYKTFLFDVSWRSIYILSAGVVFVFAQLQIFLTLRWNVAWGIPDVAFAVGDDLIMAFFEYLHIMPYIIMYLMLCPEGAEGTTFALLTTINSLASVVASTIGSYLTKIWDVSNDALAAGDYRGVLYLTILTSCIQISPIVLVGLIPADRKEHQKAIDEGKSSFWGGLFVACVICFSIVFTLYVNFSLLL